MGNIEEVKKKREYSQIPDSIIKKALTFSKDDVKEARAFLRKYFGVFLTNRVIKGKIDHEEMLLAHKSSQHRNYEEFYRTIKKVTGPVSSIVDLGSGVNGYSYDYIIREFNEIEYTAIEAVGQVVKPMNDHFNRRNNVKARAIQADLYDLTKITDILSQEPRPRLVFLFQVIDALEGLEHDYSKKLLLALIKETEFIALSLPTETLGAKKKFSVNRLWLTSFLEQHFTILSDYTLHGERVIIIGAKR